MPKYMVYSYETVFYNTIVEAESEEAAMELIDSGEVECGDIQDSCDFQVDSAVLLEKLENA